MSLIPVRGKTQTQTVPDWLVRVCTEIVNGSNTGRKPKTSEARAPAFSPEETAHLDSIPHSDTRRRESSCPAHTRLLPRTAEFYHSTREHAADHSRRH